MSPPSHQPPHQPPHRHHNPPHQPPPPPPPQYQFYPYPPPHHHRKRSSKTFASCILATCFLLTLVVAAAITLFILFRPQNPVIAITAVKLPTFTPNSTTLINFTLLQYSTVRNPNRYDFTHHSSSVQLSSPSVGPVGFIYIPAARIGGGRTQDITADFEVKSLSAGPGPTLEVETKMRLVGSVKVMQVFAHHVDTSVSCRISVQLTDGALLGYHC